MGLVLAMGVGLFGKDILYVVCFVREGLLLGIGYREEISCGRNWLREVGILFIYCL